MSDGAISRLTLDNRTVSGLSWTPDGGNLVFASNRRGAYQLWKIRSEGGPALHVPTDSGSSADVALSSTATSIDGRSLLFNLDNGSLWTSHPDGSEASPITPSIRSSPTINWCVNAGDLFFTRQNEKSFELWRLSRQGKELLGTRESRPIAATPGLDVSPDGRYLLFAEEDSAAGDINSRIRKLPLSHYSLPAHDKSDREISKVRNDQTERTRVDSGSNVVQEILKAA